MLIEPGTLTLVLPPIAARRSLALNTAPRYRVTISAADLVTPMTAVATGAAEARTLEIAGVPLGANRVITLSGEDAAGVPVVGAVYMAVTALSNARNRVVLSAATTAVGRVWARWLATGQAALATAQDPTVILRRLDAIKQADNLPHFAFIDTNRWADAAAQATHSDVGLLGFAIQPGSVDLVVSGAPTSVPGDIWLDDPASPLQSGLSQLTSQSGGAYRIKPVLPGTWTIFASVPGMAVATASVTVSAGVVATATLTFPGWVPAPALPTAIGNAAIATDGRFIYVLGGVGSGGTLQAGTYKLDTSAAIPAWAPMQSLPKAREGAIALVLGPRLFIAGGQTSGGVVLSDVQFIAPANPSGWVQVPSPPALTGSCQTQYCPDAGLPIGAFGDGGLMAILWTVFNESTLVPYSRGHFQAFDPDADSWKKDPDNLPQIRTPRRRPGFGLVGNALVVAGGDQQVHEEGNAFALSTALANPTVEALDLTTRKWAAWPDMPTPRAELAVADVGGKLYAVGGVDPANYVLDTVEIYDPAAGRWAPGPPLRTPRSTFGLVKAGGRLWAIGGSPSRRLNDSIDGMPTATDSVETLVVGP